MIHCRRFRKRGGGGFKEEERGGEKGEAKA